MLLYSSLHPDWDYFGEFASSPQGVLTADLFQAITLCHYHTAKGCFSDLEDLGFFLGNGAFSMAMIQEDPSGAIDIKNTDWAKQVIDFAKLRISGTLWHCFTIGGKIYILCCFPRLAEGDPEADQALMHLHDTFIELQTALESEYPALRIILSDFEYGAMGIFRAYSQLYHAAEYYDFLSHSTSPVHLDSQRQLLGAFTDDMSVYRQFSVAISEQLSREESTVEAISKDICDTILKNSVPSMESLHHHLQLFMLTFTDYLGSAGMVDVSYIKRHNIVSRAMGFEKEATFRRTMLELITELQQQNKTLRTIGRQKRIQTIRAYVEEHITDPNLTITQISDRFHLCKAHLAKQFRYYYGLTLYQFIQQRRLQCAQALLQQQPTWSMREIATAAGYSDLSTMYRAFRSINDVTPGALRNALRQEDVPESEDGV